MGSALYIKIAKITVLSLVTAYFIYCAVTPSAWHFFDGVDVVVHEAGHIVFMPLGEFVSFLGGTLLQVIIPSAFLVYFLVKRQLYSGSFVMAWLGQNLVNISVYMKDAIAMNLPLIGGGIHDWNWIFSRIGLLSQSPVIGSVTYFLGFAVIVIAGAVGVYDVIKNTKEPEAPFV